VATKNTATRTEPLEEEPLFCDLWEAFPEGLWIDSEAKAQNDLEAQCLKEEVELERMRRAELESRLASSASSSSSKD